MGRLVARHGVSGANDNGNPAFGSPEAFLLPAGIEQAKDLGLRLPGYGIDPWWDDIAVSTLNRTGQTARVAGGLNIKQYAQLDEIPHGLNLEEFIRMKETRIIPLHVMRGAEETLKNPPPEEFWVGHALRTTAMCQILGVYQDEERFFPKFCEVRYLPIGD